MASNLRKSSSRDRFRKIQQRMKKGKFFPRSGIPPPFLLSREKDFYERLARSPGRERILCSFLRLAAFVGFYEALLGCSRVESILQLFTYVYLVTRERVHCSNSDDRTYAGIINESLPVIKRNLLVQPIQKLFNSVSLWGMERRTRIYGY